jgi:hypothetical protein
MSGPNYAALKAAMATGGAYAGMTDAQVLAAVNAASVPVSVDVQMSAVLDYLALNGLLPTVRGWANTAPTPASGLTAAQSQAAVVSAQTLGMMVADPSSFPVLSFSSATTAAQIEAMLGAVVTGGLMPQSTANALLALSAQTVSQASLWGFAGDVFENDLIAARALS